MAVTTAERPPQQPQPVPPDEGVHATRLFTRRSVLPIDLGLILIISAGDYYAGVELPFTVLYILPIGIGAWFRGPRFAVALSALATVSIAVSLVHDHVSSFATAWNVAPAALAFLATSWGVDQLRTHLERERAMRRLAVEELRHTERLNVIGTLAAGVAHELGTPLNVIVGCTELIAEEVTEPRVRQRTAMIQQQVTSISTIVRRLLDFGHRGGMTRARAELNQVAANACEMLASTAHQQGCKIELESGPALYVNGNAAELGQVLSNLLLNAIQAMERGTVRVKLGIETRGRDRLGVIEVADEGCGISAENLSRVFDPFFTTKDVGKGTGLGLSVSYGIIQDHGGSIEVASEVGRGSRFIIKLPLRD